MGEAKRRGTEAERREQALRDGNASAVDAIKSGIAPHYAFIFDRSSKASTVLAKMKSGPEELSSCMASSAVQFWEASHFPFVIICGSWGYTGGLTLPCLDIDTLLGEGLPAVFQRTNEKGGLCAFVPFVADELVEAIYSRIAELQPSSGPAGPIQ
jgi:hypothetical protein